MKKPFLLLLFALCAPAFGYNFARRATVTIPAASGSTTQTNFTAYFTMSDLYLATTAYGGQIQHTTTRLNLGLVPVDFILTSDAGCSTLAGSYNWNFTAYSAASGTATVRVLIPSYSTAITMYACFGDPGTSTWQGGTTDNTMAMNWPMNDNAANSTVTDYSTAAANGTYASSVTTTSKSATGQLDLGLSFTSTSSNYISRAAPVNINSAGYYIFSMWYKTPATLPTSNQSVLGIQNGVSDGNVGMLVYNVCTSGPSCTLNSWNGNAGYNFGTTGFVAASTWYHIVVFRSKGSPNHEYLYYNGTHFVDASGSAGGNDFTNLYVGVGGTGGYASGTIDELEVYNSWPASATTCSTAGACADWVATLYANQSNPPAAAASTNALIDYLASGPTTGYVRFPSAAYTLTKNVGNFTSSTTITVSDGGAGGTITAGSNCTGSGVALVMLTPVGGYNTCTFTYTAINTTAVALSFVGGGMSGANPANLSYSATIPSLAISGCTTATLSTASGTCTVTLTGGTFNGAYAVTLKDYSGSVGNGGTFTPSVGSPGVSSVTVIPASTSSFTFTYTPAHVGTILISLTNVQGWTNPGSWTITATSADVCAFTAKASGDWGAQATWTPSGCTGGGHTTPHSGDSVVITGYTVTCANSETCYAGRAPSNNTTYDIIVAPTSGASGVLEVQGGGRLWLTGNYQLNSTQGSSPATFGILQVDTGGTVIHDENNNASVIYRGVGPASSGSWNNIKIGTPGDACTVGTGFSYSCQTQYTGANVVGGLYPTMFDSNGQHDVISVWIYGSLIKNCGQSAAYGTGYNNECIDLTTNNQQNGYAQASVGDFENNVWDTTASVGTWGANGVGTYGKMIFIGNREVNALNGFDGGDQGGHLLNSTTSSNCTISGNYFSLMVASVGTTPFKGCLITNNVFSAGFDAAASASSAWGSFSNNLLINSVAGTAELNILNNIFYYDHPGSIVSAHMGFALNDSSVVVAGNIGDSNAAPAEKHCFLDGGSAATSALHATILDNLSVMTSYGGYGCQWFGFDKQGSVTTGPLTYMDHNGVNGSGVMGWLAFQGHGGSTYPSNAVWRTIRANLGWDPVSGVTDNQNFLIEDVNGVASPPTTMVDSGTVIDWNAYLNNTVSSLYNATTSPQAACKPSTLNGTAYQICAATGTGTTVGAHDKAATNPIYIDTARRTDTWASRVMGQAQSIDGARLALWACPDLGQCLQGLYAWIRQGWQPTNMVLKGAAHDGKIVGFNTITAGSGYSGSCGVTITARDAQDLGGSIPSYAAAATCTFSGGVPVVKLTSGGAHYRIATPAAVAITCGGCTPAVPASLTPIIQPSDIGPVPMSWFASVAP